jgi:uncharacterized protein (UPF0335 family)
MRKYTQEDVDKWVEDEGEYDAYQLFEEKLPKHKAKLDRLDKRIRDILAEIKEVFPDAQYYTASGGFTLVLGNTHETNASGSNEDPQQQRSAWSGYAQIGDGDW